jgi:hypothetical protein
MINSCSLSESHPLFHMTFAYVPLLCYIVAWVWCDYSNLLFFDTKEIVTALHHRRIEGGFSMRNLRIHTGIVSTSIYQSPLSFPAISIMSMVHGE